MTAERDRQSDVSKQGVAEIGKRAREIATVKPPTGDFKQVDTD